MIVYMLVDCTKYSLPLDVALTLKELSIRWNIPLQTLKNRCSDGKCIKYVNVYVERIKLPQVPKKRL